MNRYSKLRKFTITYKDVYILGGFVTNERIHGLQDQYKAIEAITAEVAKKKFLKWYRKNVYSYRSPIITSISE